MRKSKTALSKRFPRLNTTLKAIQNLTRSQISRIGQVVLILIAFVCGGLAMYHQHIPLCFAAIVAVVAAFLLEGFID
jgi:phage shock protein PspC (stress-responsive transcriptional regulator)